MGKARGNRLHGRGLQVIAAFKLLKAVAFFAVGVGALKLLHKEIAGEAEHWVNIFRLDPHNPWINRLLEKLPMLDERRLKELSAGTFFYAALFLTEGLGLAFERRWAEYLTIVATASLLPPEVYELVRNPNVGKVIALVISIGIVTYLIIEMRHYSKKAQSP